MIKKNAVQIKKLPEPAQRIINQYRNLSLGGKTIVTPYFMNERGKKGKRVFVGKGTAHEVNQITKQLAKKYNFDLEKASEKQIRDFMIIHELGIDCSGLVAWALNALTNEKLHKPIWKVLKFTMLPLIAQLKRHIRPIENISVRILTHPLNTDVITDLEQIRVGDMIRALNGHHILLITEIVYDKDHHPTSFTYVNSTEYNNKKYGIREGTVEIKQRNKYLIEQKWQDEEEGVNWIYNAVKDFPTDSRIVRLKALNSN